jgi:hypothetical protein
MSAITDNQTRPLQSEVDNGQDPLLAQFQKLKKDILDAERARASWRKYVQECNDFVMGHQWSDEDSRILASQNRPKVAFNRVAPLVKAVCGLEVNNRQSIIYLPRTQGVVGPNEMVTAAGRWIRDECNAEDEESKAFRDLAIGGEGWTETRMDYDEDPMGKIVVNKGASRANYADARMIYRIREMDPDDVRALLDLPDDIDDAALDAVWLNREATPADGGIGNKKDFPSKTRSGVGDQNTGPKRTVKIVQCQYWRRETLHLVATANDEQPMQLSTEDYATFQERANAMNEAAAADVTGQTQPFEFSHAQTTKKVYYQCFIGIRILSSEPLEMGMFQFGCMTGDYDTKKKWFVGMVGDMLDPQRWSNKFLAQIMNIMNANSKGGLLAETDAFVNQKAAQRDWSDPTKIVWVKPGAISKNKVKTREQIQLPSGLDQLMMFAISSIRDVTGINLELLGQADREQAASLEQQRRQSAMTILATMFDNLCKYRKLDGRLQLRFIALLPEGTLIRVVEKGQYQYIPLLKNELDFEKFDVIIDQAPTSPDQKQYIWSITESILQMNILPPAAMVQLLKYSPYPESVVQEIGHALGLDGPTAEQLQQKLQQAEQALQILEQQLHEATAKANTAENANEIEMLKVAIESYRAETERLREQWNAQLKQASNIVAAHAASSKPTPSAGGEGQPAAPQASRPVPAAVHVPLPTEVISGTETLPDIGAAAEAGVAGSGGGGPVPPTMTSLEEKVDAIAGMLQQFLGAMQQGQQQGPVPPPEAQQQPVE